MKHHSSQHNVALPTPLVRKFVTPKVSDYSNKLRLGLGRCHLEQKAYCLNINWQIGCFFNQSRETQITMVKWTNAGGQTKRANERSFVYRPPPLRRWRNVKTTNGPFLDTCFVEFRESPGFFFFNYAFITLVKRHRNLSRFDVWLILLLVVI